MIDIKNLLVPEKETKITVSGFPGFSVNMVYLGPERIKELQSSCMTTEFDRKLKTVRETLDEDKFSHEFSKAVIKNWEGLTLGYLEQLALVDIGDNDPDNLVTYTQENAEALLRNSAEFMSWVNEVVFDLNNFRRDSTTIPKRTTKDVPGT